MLFVEIVNAAAGDQVGPMFQLGAYALHAIRQLEARQVRSENVRTKQRLGFDRHSASLDFEYAGKSIK